MKDTTDPQIKRIMEEIEKTAHDLQYSFQISDKLIPAVERAREIGDKDTERKLIWEYQLFRFVTKTEFAKPERDRRFYPMMSGTTKSGQIVNFPEIKDFKEDSIAYFKKRANETGNPVLKARYADFVWDLEKDPVSGKIAVASHLGSVEDFYKKTWFFRLQDVFDRCVYLAMLKVVGQDELREIKKRLLDYIERTIQDGHHRFCIELIDAFLAIKKENVTQEECKKVLTNTNQCIKYFQAQRDLHLQRSFLERLEKIAGKCNQTDLARRAKEQQAQTHVADAKLHETKENFLAAASCYEDTLKVFQQLGDKRKIKFYKTKLMEANRKSTGQFKKISTDVRISSDKIKQFTDIILSAPDLVQALSRLSVFDNLLPNYRDTVAQTGKMREKNPLQFLITHKVVGRNGHLVSGGSDPFQSVLVRNLMMGIGIASIFRNTIFKRLCTEKGLTAKSLTGYLKKWGFIDAENLKLIEHGIKRHFEQDYISSIHILVPQFEAIMRKLLKKGGIQTVSFVPGTTATREAPLTELLEREEVKTVLGEDLWWYTYLILVSPLGYNLRNEVAHGLIEARKCNLTTSNLVFHLYILLTRFRLAKDKSKQSRQNTD